MSSPNVQSRTFACRSLQNLSQDKSCRQDIAITNELVESLVQRVSLSENEEEKLAAVSTLKNLADERKSTRTDASLFIQSKMLTYAIFRFDQRRISSP